MTGSGDCFHCGERVVTGRRYLVHMDGEDRPVCCAGCKAVAEFIRDTGLTDYYRFRTAEGLRPESPEPDDIRPEWLAFDRDALQKNLTSELGGGRREILLLIEGVRCAACSWLLERVIGHMEGVAEFQVNPASARARLVWHPDRTQLSRLLDAIARLGYRPHPVSGAGVTSASTRERRQAMKRLAVAGLGMMQVMTYAVSLYAGAWQGMDEQIREFLRLVSLLVATPVVLYSGLPFFTGAWRDLRAGRPGMDVPVALAIGGAYLASIYNSIRGSGEVYFDSVTMFVFFLSLGRFAEMAARHRSGEISEALARLSPSTALRFQPGSRTPVPVGIAELSMGDRVLVRTGDTFPADGRLEEGRTYVDESMLTGESRPVARRPGDPVVGGSVNRGDPVEITVERIGGETVLSHVSRLLDRAQSQRPAIARSADLVARWFVAGVLIIASGVAALWSVVDATAAFEVTLSVLVVTCPCALSLATPTALTAATARLARSGLLVTRSDALEPLARADIVMMDKTGTLTQGRVSLSGVRSLGELSEHECLRIAAALERTSEHPLATALQGSEADKAEDLTVFPGEGVEGVVERRRFRIGTPSFVAGISKDEEAGRLDDRSSVVLGDADGFLAEFAFDDPIRNDAGITLSALRAAGLVPEIASGDSEYRVRELGKSLEMDRLNWRQSPEDKLRRIRSLQTAGHRVVMVGDGVNDAPVLAAADVSVAMGAGAPLAQTTADMILLGDSLGPLVTGVDTARRALRVVRQNIIWAILYNLTALPLAAAGLVAPWMAAIGMSASSLLVVLNSARLSRGPAPNAGRPVEGLAARDKALPAPDSSS